MRSVLFVDPPAFCARLEVLLAPALRTRPLAIAPPAADRAIILALSEADPVEITTLSGKEALKNALKDAINRVLTNREGFGGIDDVYFTSFVTQ